MGSAALSEAIKSIREWSLNEGRASTTPAKATDIFGSLAFTDKVQQERLPKAAYRALRATITRGETLDLSTADAVATALKDWAVEHGATHYTHWFQPMTGITAEKHDSFLSPTSDGGAIAEFRGKELIKGEPDASSFPSGGMRSTFEARGYTAWDPTSPPWLHVNGNSVTLVIPTAFVSWTGEALDKKTPLLRSMEAVSKQAVRVLKLFGSTAERVFATCGPEQEYFLIDRNFYFARPDLINAGRTLFGARPPKGQELEDQYFGSIPERVLGCMAETEMELFKVGVPVKTRHNEVAPSQYETAPIFEEANVASDHNQIVMETMSRVARRHNLACLLHEKPFAGVNGSGKHCNWSLSDSDGDNLLEPGATPESNLQFLVFLTATLRAVHRRAGLLRAAIASSGNDHRLGANEAPPAIISVFLGEQLTRVLDAIERGETTGAGALERISVGIRNLPEVARDQTDRNRTSPFAFTGNKFEFRAVSSAASISIPVAFLNAALAESLGEFEQAIGGRLGRGMTLQDAVLEVVREAVIATKAIRFEGNNYSAEWVEEAKRRGIPNLRTTPEALAELVRPDTKEFLAKLKIFTEPESDARFHVRMERYIKDIDIEVEALKNLVSGHVLPAAFKQLALLAGAGQGKAVKAAVERMDGAVEAVSSRLAELQSACERASGGHDVGAHARALAEHVVPAMAAVREACDRIEESVADEFWTLPKYREMLSLI